MTFKSKKIDLTLELEGLDGTTKKYLFNKDGIVNASIAEKFSQEFHIFESANRELPEKERKSISDVILYEIAIVYPGFDKKWAKDNFTTQELSDIIRWVSLGMGGVKND